MTDWEGEFGGEVLLQRQREEGKQAEKARLFALPKTIMVREPKSISNGLVVSKEAFIEIDGDVRDDFLQMFLHYYNRGLIRVKVAKLEERL